MAKATPSFFFGITHTSYIAYLILFLFLQFKKWKKNKQQKKAFGATLFDDVKDRSLKWNFGGDEAFQFILEELSSFGYKYSDFTAAQIKYVVKPFYLASRDDKRVPWWKRETIGYGWDHKYFFWVCTLDSDNLPNSFKIAGIRKIHFLRDAIKIVLDPDMAESHEKIATKMEKYFPGFKLVHNAIWNAKENHVYLFKGDYMNRRELIQGRDFRRFLYKMSHKLRAEDPNGMKIMKPRVQNKEHALHLLETKLDLYNY